MPRKQTTYGCEFKCGNRWTANKARVIEHERHCYKNPDRIPRDGELTWFKQIAYDKIPDWWPGIGKIYISGKWHDVDGYKSEPIGGAGCKDVWPDKIGQMNTRDRLMWWFGYEQPLVGPKQEIWV